VAAGDDYDETALRELEEELGVKAGFGDPALQLQLRRLLKIDAHKETGWEFVWVYLAKGDGPFVLNSTEIRKGGWYALAAVDRWMERRPAEFAESFRFLWPRVRDELDV
jgi:8-oxo-dGTP pyrophosphatase MutT (NUDIX family)